MYYDEERNAIVLHGKHGNEDFISLELGDRYLVNLEGGEDIGKGKNSSVFIAIDPNSENDDLAIKFCNHHEQVCTELQRRKRRRFIREIRALKAAKKLDKNDFIIEICEDGSKEISGKNFLYYVMELLTPV